MEEQRKVKILAMPVCQGKRNDQVIRFVWLSISAQWNFLHERQAAIFEKLRYWNSLVMWFHKGSNMINVLTKNDDFKRNGKVILGKFSLY